MEHALRPKVVLLAGLVMGLVVALVQLLSSSCLLPDDAQLLQWVNGLSSTPLRLTMAGLYRLTGKGTMPALVLIALTLLAQRRQWADLGLVAAACGGVFLWVDLVLKPWIGRSRPPEPLLSIDGSSFPSGHSAGAVVFSLSLALVLARSWPRQRHLLLLLSGIWSALVGLSTLVVRAHWPSDVLGGYALGLAWLGLCLAVWRRAMHS